MAVGTGCYVVASATTGLAECSEVPALMVAGAVYGATYGGMWSGMLKLRDLVRSKVTELRTVVREEEALEKECERVKRGGILMEIVKQKEVEIKRMQKDIEVKNHEVNSLVDELEGYLQLLSAEKEKNQLLEKESDILKKHNTVLKEQNREGQENEKSLDAENSVLKEQNIELLDQKEELEKRITEVELECKAWRQMFEACEKEFHRVVEENKIDRKQFLADREKFEAERAQYPPPPFFLHLCYVILFL